MQRRDHSRHRRTDLSSRNRGTCPRVSGGGNDGGQARPGRFPPKRMRHQPLDWLARAPLFKYNADSPLGESALAAPGPGVT